MLKEAKPELSQGGEEWLFHGAHSTCVEAIAAKGFDIRQLPRDAGPGYLLCQQQRLQRQVSLLPCRHWFQHAYVVKLLLRFSMPVLSSCLWIAAALRCHTVIGFSMPVTWLGR